MKSLSRVGVVLSVIFGCLLLALFAELYYLLCWKKKRLTIPDAASGSSIEQGHVCSDSDSTSKSSQNCLNLQHQQQDLNNLNDLNNLDSDKEFLFKIPGPPRFLFTIVEETKEDMESDDGKCCSRPKVKRSLSVFLAAVESQTPYLTPVASPSLFSTPPIPPNGAYRPNGGFGSDPHSVESCRDAEFNRMRRSPPPKFKFLQDAEEKLRRKLAEESEGAQRVNVDDDTPPPSSLRLAKAVEEVMAINI